MKFTLITLLSLISLSAHAWEPGEGAKTEWKSIYTDLSKAPCKENYSIE